MKTIIKHHRNNNRYYLTKTGLWVRDYTCLSAPEDINYLISTDDYGVVLENEMKNVMMNIASIDAETIFTPNVIIVSDGFDFTNKQHLLKDIPQTVTIIGTNRSLVKWAGPRRMDWFVANNPYKECMGCLPNHNYYPRCVVSTRTYHNFINRYRARLGVMYRYVPTPDDKFSSSYFSAPSYYVDDYRNSICAAIALAYRWEVQRLMLFCCDNSFEGERPGAEKLENGLWMYPQHHVSCGLFDGMIYWLTQREGVKVKVVDHSAGPKYEYVPHIKEDELLRFFS